MNLNIGMYAAKGVLHRVRSYTHFPTFEMDSQSPPPPTGVYTVHPNPLRHSDPVRQALCAAEQAQTCLPGQRALNEACSCQLCSQIRPHLADKCDKCRIRKVFRHHLSMCELLYPSQRHQLPELLLRPRLEHVQLPGGEESLLEYVTQC